MFCLNGSFLTVTICFLFLSLSLPPRLLPKFVILFARTLFERLKSYFSLRSQLLKHQTKFHSKKRWISATYLPSYDDLSFIKTLHLPLECLLTCYFNQAPYPFSPILCFSLPECFLQVIT